MTANPIRIVIADDHPVVRSGLMSMLESQPDFEVAGEAENGKRAVELVEKLSPGIVLMDLRMPVMDGVAAIEAISAKHPRTRILVLTTYDSDSDILRAVEAGATGYLLKDSPREELYEAVRSTASGKPRLTPMVAHSLMKSIREPRPQKLSRREIEVLEFVRKGLSNKEVGRELHISEATVKTHLIHAFGKLGVDDRTAAVNTALERGFLRLER